MIRPNRLRWLLSASLALAFAPGLALAQQNSPPPAAEEDDGASMDEIVVLASPGDSVRIDRRTYTLREDATAQSTDMFEVLGRIPSVSVAPSGEVTLLGAANVIIQIDGQPVPGANLEQVLRGLPGREVERIEVITNPSAQYSAQASGGIINIITRNRFEGGFNGSVQSSLDSLGGWHLGLAPSWSGRRWSFSGQGGGFGGGQENSFTREREVGGAATYENGPFNFDYDGWYLSRLRASYQATDKRRLSVILDGGAFSGRNRQTIALADAGGPISTTQSSGGNDHERRQITFQFHQDGAAPRELLKFEIALREFENGSHSAVLFSPAGGGAGRGYTNRFLQETQNADIDLNLDKPLKDGRFLTLGASYDYNDHTILTQLTPTIGAAPPAFFGVLDAVEENFAAYATYQFDTGDWTWLPGLRAENYRRRVTAVGVEDDDTDLRYFPSLHIRRAMTPNINIDVSYTSRIQRPGVSQLDPSVRYSDVNRASTGNPNLEPSTTDAFEANFVYQKSGTSFSVTLFNRLSEDIFSQLTETTVDGIILSRPVNAGESEQLGLQALLRGPLNPRWRYSLSGNVQNREFDVLSGGAIQRRSEIEYDGIVQLDYRDPDQDAVGADQLQFEVRFQGPRFGLQSETEAFAVANVTWRRKLAPRLYGVLAVQDIFDSTSQITEIRTDTYTERTEFEGQGTRVRFGLTYQFGSGPQRPPQDQPPPIPM